MIIAGEEALLKHLYLKMVWNSHLSPFWEICKINISITLKDMFYIKHLEAVFIYMQLMFFTFPLFDFSNIQFPCSHCKEWWWWKFYILWLNEMELGWWSEHISLLAIPFSKTNTAQIKISSLFWTWSEERLVICCLSPQRPLGHRINGTNSCFYKGNWVQSDSFAWYFITCLFF